MLSGSAMSAGDMQPKESTDINFFVSGALNSRGTSTRGTAVFGGDLVTSGATHLLGGVRSELTLAQSDGTNFGILKERN